MQPLQLLEHVALGRRPLLCWSRSPRPHLGLQLILAAVPACNTGCYPQNDPGAPLPTRTASALASGWRRGARRLPAPNPEFKGESDRNGQPQPAGLYTNFTPTPSHATQLPVACDATPCCGCCCCYCLLRQTASRFSAASLKPMHASATACDFSCHHPTPTRAQVFSPSHDGSPAV